MNQNYIHVDLSRMLELPKCAVICRTLEEAKMLFQNARDQLAEYMIFDLEDAPRLWNRYKSATGFTVFSAYSAGYMTYCREEWFLDCGYEIIDFATLVNSKEITESTMSLDELLGIVT